MPVKNKPDDTDTHNIAFVDHGAHKADGSIQVDDKVWTPHLTDSVFIHKSQVFQS